MINWSCSATRFAAPQGYDKGGTVSDELAADRNILNELDPADLFALVMKSEIRDDENSEEQAKHFGSMVMNRVRNGSFGGKDLKTGTTQRKSICWYKF